MPHHASRGTCSPRHRAMSAAHTGWVATSATDDATDVNDRLGTHVAKWAARNSPATSARRRSRRSSVAASRRRSPGASTTAPRTGSASALRQNAIASDGASAARISGADVDTATTATPSSARSTAAAGARVPERSGGSGGGTAARSLAHPLPLHHPCENLGRRGRRPGCRGGGRPGAPAAADGDVQPVRAGLRRRPLRAVRRHPGRRAGAPQPARPARPVPLRGLLRAACAWRAPASTSATPRNVVAPPLPDDLADRDGRAQPRRSSASTRPTTPGCAGSCRAPSRSAAIERLRDRVQRPRRRAARRPRRRHAPAASPSTSSPASPSRCRSWSSASCWACPTATATSCGPGRTR